MFKIKLQHIHSDNLATIACTDLGAYREIGKNKLKNTKIKTIIIMEDRLPDFYLEYDKFEPNKDTTLNRHGPFKFLFTQKHLKDLVTELQTQRIKVFIGFWGQLLDPHKKQTCSFINQHPELWRLNKEDEKNTDLDPLVTLQPEKISFAKYIVQQFQKLHQDFNFNGLFLGDGFNGYRLFTNPQKYEDQEATKNQWKKFYQKVAAGVQQQNCQLMAYDCLGLPPEKAVLHGADYLAQAQAGLDYLVVQTYPTAWGKKWLKNYPGFDFNSCLQNLQKTKNLLKGTKCKTIYTLEMGDKVEEWKPSYWTTKRQLKKFKEYANGKMLVWANDLFYDLL